MEGQTFRIDSIDRPYICVNCNGNLYYYTIESFYDDKLNMLSFEILSIGDELSCGLVNNQMVFILKLVLQPLQKIEKITNLPK